VAVARGVLAGDVRGVVTPAADHLGSSALDALEAR
jgi:hypothetical protein